MVEMVGTPTGRAFARPVGFAHPTHCIVDDAIPLRHVRAMTQTKLDLTGLKCPLPALKTRKALKSVKPGDILEVHCTDPLSVIDIPNLIRETGDKVEITERTEQRIVFLIEKARLDVPGLTT
jgi:tRNA 2-thiouridine synthesizing protein A